MASQVRTESFRPSNGTGGDIFRSMFCDKCERDRYPSKPCRIFTLTMVHDIDDKEYPKEWIQDADKPWGENNPRCTAFRPYRTTPRIRNPRIRDKRQVGLPL